MPRTCRRACRRLINKSSIYCKSSLQIPVHPQFYSVPKTKQGGCFTTFEPATWPEMMCSRELPNGSFWWPPMPLRVGDSMCQIGSHDGSMGRLFVYLHENHKNQPSVGKDKPYMDAVGMWLCFWLAWSNFPIISDKNSHQIGFSCNMNIVPLKQKWSLLVITGWCLNLSMWKSPCRANFEKLFTIRF